MCPELDKLKSLLHAPKAPLNPPPLTGENTTPARYKALRTNYACTICVEYKNYTHNFPNIPRYRDALGTLAQANIVIPSLLATPMADDVSKTIFLCHEGRSFLLISLFWPLNLPPCMEATRISDTPTYLHMRFMRQTIPFNKLMSRVIGI